MADLPLFDARGSNLVAFQPFDSASPVDKSGSFRTVCSLVVVQWNHKVLFGFNVARQQWELPGGGVEHGESPREAALRELREETGISVEGMSPVANAEMMLDGDVARFAAAIYYVSLEFEPEVVESEELARFTWWEPSSELIEGQSPIDAEIVRRSVREK